MKKYLISGLFSLFGLVAYGLGSDGKFPYDTLPGDPLHGRIYHLANGLTVFISVNKAEPKIQTLIAVKAGSKYDPSDASGLAHYLEHMLFKGTTHYGTSDYAKEKPLLDIIENLFETYRHTKDTNKRKSIYRKIDSISNIASQYAIANEYNKMMSFIGSEGTNAHTSEDKTVFEENIPSNELDTWLEIESDRFKNPVMRLFHTELEVVYEEKNMDMDDLWDRVNEAMLSGLFHKHPYGAHTTIGTIHDLKNPSLKDIINYFHTYYVPNNMVITLCGDLNPDEAIGKVNSWFGNYVSHPVPAFIPPKEDSITQPVIKTITCNCSPFVELSYRLGGAGTNDADMLRLIQEMMANGKSGILEEDMAGRIENAKVYTNILKDYSIFMVSASPKNNQTVEQVKDSLLKEVNKLMTGNFPQLSIEGAVNNLKVNEMNDFHSNLKRGQRFADAFATGESWSSSITRINRIARFSRNDVMKFAKTHFGNNYVSVYLEKGKEENKEKVIKPPITPIHTNPNAESAFLQKIESERPQPLQPVFADYDNKIKQYELKPGLTLYYVRNTEDSLFDLTYRFEMGRNNIPKLYFALEGLYGGYTSYFSTYQIRQEFYRMGCNFTTRLEDDNFIIELKGLGKNFPQALNLMESLFKDILIYSKNKEKEIQYFNASRDFIKKNKDWLVYALKYYAQYGKESSFRYMLSDDLINTVQEGEIQYIIRSLLSYPHSLLYYGPTDAPHLAAEIQQYHQTPAKFNLIPAPRIFPKQKFASNVYVLNIDIRQAEVYIYQPGAKYNPLLQPLIALYNQYFGGSQGSLVLQTLRESDALTYSASSSFYQPEDTNETGYVCSEFKTQADKLPSAIDGMIQLLYDSLAYHPQLWLTAKDAVMKNVSLERINREDLLSNYLKTLKLGINYDINEKVYENVPYLKFGDIQSFHNKYIASQPYNIVIIGNAQLMDMNSLSKYGKITYLKMGDIFGF